MVDRTGPCDEIHARRQRSLCALIGGDDDGRSSRTRRSSAAESRSVRACGARAKRMAWPSTTSPRAPVCRLPVTSRRSKRTHSISCPPRLIWRRLCQGFRRCRRAQSRRDRARIPRREGGLWRSVDAGSSYVSEEPASSGSGGLVRIALILLVIAAIAFGLWKSGMFGGFPVRQVAPPAGRAAGCNQPVVPPAAPDDSRRQRPQTDENSNEVVGR